MPQQILAGGTQSIVMKCFERLNMMQINSLGIDLNPCQFPYHHKRSIAGEISLAHRYVMNCLDNKNIYIRLLIVDYSSSFNTIIPSKLILKPRKLIRMQLEPWLPQRQTPISMDWQPPHSQSAEASRGCMLSPLLSILSTFQTVYPENSPHAIF